MKVHKEFHTTEFQKSETEVSHPSLKEEYTLFQAVKSGNINYVKKYCSKKTFSNLESMSVFSTDPLKNIKYHFAISVAMLTRQCVEGGLEYELAFRLCDFYILKTDSLTTIESIIQLYNTMLLDFTNRMSTLNSAENFFSKSVALCKEYIYNHLHDRITINILAEYVNLSPSYLSRLFKKEVGMSVSDYIRSKKIERAENLLRFSEYTLIEITNYLAFSSQSHFIQTFEKQVGLTPKKYRDKYQRALW